MDSIRKHIHLKAPVERVWQAVSDAEAFGAWFGMKVAGPFVANETVMAHMTEPPEWAGFEFALFIGEIQAPTRFSFRWHPYPVDVKDYANEPTTLVEFLLEPTADGTALTVVESGFEAVPEARRAEAFKMNDQGWTHQVENIRRYVER